MKILVTGAAGFIGSHLCQALLKNSAYHVVGIDHFIGPTPATLKIDNIQSLKLNSRFQFIQEDILNTDLPKLLQDIDVVYHLAAIPGVRTSWGKDFQPYVSNNIMVTQQLLEACKHIQLDKFIHISTSSVYGEKSGAVSEDLLPTPLSPYGVTKLSGEHLCHVYHKNFHIPIVILRYFTVYGPRQRPDMAFHRLIKQLLVDKPLTIFGDGTQTRDFTYIDDCIRGTVAALETKKNIVGEVINIGGKEQASILDIISMLEKISGKSASKKFLKSVPGEPKQTWADISKASTLLQYSPTVSLSDGLKAEFHYIKQLYKGD
ncbi:UDP-glucose 4-epimerase [Bacillus cereus]|uniref:NAD-dependent epimerase/dehydratase family protein n=1 Tax=Bacillus TaxID=1386 RepID=UPI0002D506ED|nr:MULTISPECIES: NAD-dependent epimerase/dehydratase family protein [Bacillus]KAF6689421.1 NAD-dependent epimerase/dehydratase family protein [Bacillus sp. EKM501B]MEB9547587.1 NAD-dependent epimerase/dehydratase family protein [Bacillus cereus]MEB9833131.1 NAD-dependent epimerase/dehydratase family protein [Bacillus cereus]MEB9845257.1 NAD-dependent epimerase/dehydratase family protein [Bacillus cereus]MEB9880405.1 NAD-dependent epimerase/dehydratase family protein [Bacillus cereus]